MPGHGPPPTCVVYYHRIGAVEVDPVTGRPDDGGAMITPVENLVAHVTLLRERGYSFVTAGELAERWRDGRPPPGLAVLTFDDGWRDALTTAAPVLRRLDVRATFFLCPGGFGNRFPHIDEDAVVMTEDEARALHEAGMELGSHSVTHPDLRVLKNPFRLRHELVASRRAIEDLTGEPCVTFAYPSGLRNRRVALAVAAAGYRLAFIDRSGPWRKRAAPRVHAPTVKPPEVLMERLETYQRADGSVTVPDALRPYMGGQERIVAP